MKKDKIPSSLRQMVWLTYNDERFRTKCHVNWCKNTITPFTFEVGHNRPESKGGKTVLENLLPICSSCNRSMGNQYTITEYSERFTKLKKTSMTQNPPSLMSRLLKKLVNRFGCMREQENV